MSTESRSEFSSIWLLFVAGPVIWFAHFMAVYLLVEAGCAAGGLDRRVFGRHVLSIATLGATAAAILVTVLASTRAYAAWRAEAASGDWLEITDRNAGLAFAGFLLSVGAIAAICFVGIPAAFLEPC